MLRPFDQLQGAVYYRRIHHLRSQAHHRKPTLLRFFESGGRLRRAVSVVKKRVGPHEDTIREFKISPAGLAVGEPLEEFRGILTGVPTYEGKKGDLLKDKPS